MPPASHGSSAEAADARIRAAAERLESRARAALEHERAIGAVRALGARAIERLSER